MSKWIDIKDADLKPNGERIESIFLYKKFVEDETWFDISEKRWKPLPKTLEEEDE